MICTINIPSSSKITTLFAIVALFIKIKISKVITTIRRSWFIFTDYRTTIPTPIFALTITAFYPNTI